MDARRVAELVVAFWVGGCARVSKLQVGSLTDQDVFDRGEILSIILCLLLRVSGSEKKAFHENGWDYPSFM